MFDLFESFAKPGLNRMNNRAARVKNIVCSRVYSDDEPLRGRAHGLGVLVVLVGQQRQSIPFGSFHGLPHWRVVAAIRCHGVATHLVGNIIAMATAGKGRNGGHDIAKVSAVGRGELDAFAG